jgi:hypothetical protein
MKKFIEWIEANESFFGNLATDFGKIGGIVANTIQGKENDLHNVMRGDIVKTPQGQRTVGGIKNTIINPLKYGACGGRSCSRGSAPSYDFDSVDTSQGHQQLVNIKEAAVFIEQNTYNRFIEERKLESKVKYLPQELAIHVHVQGDPSTVGSIEALVQKIYHELKIDPSVKYEPNLITVGQQLVKNKKSGITINIPAAKTGSSRPIVTPPSVGVGAAAARRRDAARRR